MSGLPFPSLEDLPDPGIKPACPALAGGFFTNELPGKLSGFTSRYIRRIRGQQRTRWLDGMTDSMDMGLSKLQEMVKDKETWHAPGHGGHKESDTTEQQYKELSLERSL